MSILQDNIDAQNLVAVVIKHWPTCPLQPLIEVSAGIWERPTPRCKNQQGFEKVGHVMESIISVYNNLKE